MVIRILSFYTVLNMKGECFMNDLWTDIRIEKGRPTERNATPGKLPPGDLDGVFFCSLRDIRIYGSDSQLFWMNGVCKENSYSVTEVAKVLS